METKEQNVVTENTEKDVKVRKSLNTKQFRAFLAYCQNVQTENLISLEKGEDSLHNLLRKNSNSKSANKQIRLAIFKQQNAIRETKAKIRDLETCKNILSECEKMNNVFYQITEDFIVSESLRYKPNPEAETKDVKADQ